MSDRALRSLSRNMYMMKKLAIAAGLLVVGAASVSAQSITFRIGPQPTAPRWERNAFPYESRYHSNCQRKAWRLSQFERAAASDGRIGPRERREIITLQADLDRSCGRFRWRG